MTTDESASGQVRRRALSQLEEGIFLAREGDHENARAVFLRIIHQSPDNEDAWLWLAWVAETRQASLDYLREAQALFPHSTRIPEAIQWAEEELGLAASPAQPAPQAKGHKRATTASYEAPAPISQLAARAGQATQSAREGAAQLLNRLKPASRADRPSHASSGPKALSSAVARLRSLGVSALAWVALAAILLFVVIGVFSALGSGRGQVVQAWVLPTPVSDPTPVPSLDDLTAPLWSEVELAWGNQDWPTAIGLLEQIRAIDARNEMARKRLAVAHHALGLNLVQANDLDAARTEFDCAVRLDADNPDLQQSRRELKLYLDGLQAYQLQDWQRVVRNLKRVYQLNPDFRDTRDMLAQGYYGLGLALQEQETWEEAKTAFQSAVDLQPDFAEAQTHLGQVIDEITPPRRIEVSLSAMTVTVYENHQPIKVFRCCVGRSTAPTLPGRYAIKTKMPMAYASKWDLEMPWWLGLYDAGGSENGFHALPILSSGQVLWSGSLGTGCSFGCIVLDTDDAKFLYDWADIGTVTIVSR